MGQITGLGTFGCRFRRILARSVGSWECETPILPSHTECISLGGFGAGLGR